MDYKHLIVLHIAATKRNKNDKRCGFYWVDINGSKTPGHCIQHLSKEVREIMLRKLQEIKNLLEQE